MATGATAQTIASPLRGQPPGPGIPMPGLPAQPPGVAMTGVAAATQPASAPPAQSAIPGSGSPGMVPLGVHLAPAAADPLSEEVEDLGFPASLAGLPVGLSVAVPVRDFRVRNLLAMAPGEIIETQWGHGEDLPLASGEVQLAWTEFEVVDTKLAVRVTRLI